MNPSASPLLEVDAVSVRFSGLLAVDQVSFTVEPNIICGLIGPNGAGKTTIFNCISRIYNVASGDIRFQGVSLLKKAPHAICLAGIARTFQNLALFRSMSVLQTIMVGAHLRGQGGYIANALLLPSVRRNERRLTEFANNLLVRFDLADVRDRQVMDLPFGLQKRVELARALASKPTLLMLDEPAGGLNHDEVDDLIDVIRKIRSDFDVTILLVEHHMNLVMRLSDSVIALDFGRKIAEGSPAEIKDDPEVIRAYLGTS